MSIQYEEAKEIALKISPECNRCDEHEIGYRFMIYDKDRVDLSTFEKDVIVSKKDGSIIPYSDLVSSEISNFLYRITDITKDGDITTDIEYYYCPTLKAVRNNSNCYFDSEKMGWVFDIDGDYRGEEKHAISAEVAFAKITDTSYNFVF